MINYDEVYNATEVAIENKTLYKLFTNKKYFAELFETEEPIDRAIVVKFVYRIYEKNPSKQKEIKALLFKALTKMINGTAINLWVSAYCIFIMISTQEKKMAPFNLDKELLNLFCSKILENKDKLSKMHNYDNKAPESLFTDIERLDGILQREYAAKMLKFE